MTEHRSKPGACHSCGADLISPLVCTGCGSLQESGDVDPFSAMGLAISYRLDRAQLKKRLLQLTRHTHPDFFASASEEQRLLAEEASACLNEAHKLLADDFLRADWLLGHLGGPSESDERQMPQAFLMEVLEWNETLEEASEADPGSPEREAMGPLADELEEQRSEAMARVEQQLEPLPSHGDERLAALRRELNAIRYMDRALGQVRELRLQGS